ncbi:MAG: hypothetical protein FWD83_07770 [Promicromonosporaceae bacterium]|nr:hypothetical protein [Promicromonosporaceae bacterium]
MSRPFKILAAAAAALALTLAGCSSDSDNDADVPDVVDTPAGTPDDNGSETSDILVVENGLVVNGQFVDAVVLQVGADEIWPNYAPIFAVAEALGLAPDSFEAAVGVDGVIEHEGILYGSLAFFRDTFGVAAFSSAGEIHIGSGEDEM